MYGFGLADLWLLFQAFMIFPSQALPDNYHSCTVNFTGGPRIPYPYCNASLSQEARIKDLLERMTLFEKASILDTNFAPIPRLGFPALHSSESTHGVATGCGARSEKFPDSTGCPTSFPSGTGLGATFNTNLWAKIGQVIGQEARGLNNQGKAGIYFLDRKL